MVPLDLLKLYKKKGPGTSLVVQWLRLRASNAGNASSNPSPGTKIPHAVWLSQKKRKKAHMFTQHTVLALVSRTRTKAACVWFYLPNSFLSLPLVTKLPTPTSGIWSSPTEKDSYGLCTSTSQPQGWARLRLSHSRSPPSPPYRDWCRAGHMIQVNQNCSLGFI